MFKSNEELDSVSKELNKLKAKNQVNSILKNRDDSIEILANYQLQNLSTNISQQNGFILNFMYVNKAIAFVIDHYFSKHIF